MGDPLATPPPGFDEMSVEDQIDFVHMLWERSARRPEAVPVPEWQRRELDRRLDEMEKDGGRGRPWEDVQRDIRERLSGRE